MSLHHPRTIGPIYAMHTGSISNFWNIQIGKQNSPILFWKKNVYHDNCLLLLRWKDLVKSKAIRLYNRKLRIMILEHIGTLYCIFTFVDIWSFNLKLYFEI